MDGLSTVAYSVSLAKFLPSSWRLVQPILSSSYSGWGTTSLTRDVVEIGKCTRYLRSLRPRGRIVLLGHSTGAQQVMHYLCSPTQPGEEPRPAIAGAILQGGISDREAIVDQMSPADYDAGVALARSYVDNGRGGDVLPSMMTSAFFPSPVSADRWLSLASPDHDGEDDYFSSDLEDERLRQTFGKVGASGARVSILFSGEDEHVPKWVDKAGLVNRWVKFVQAGKGIVDEDTGVIPGADHTLSKAPPEVVQDLFWRIVRFLSRVEKQGS
jgi:pimeloyl-ACP methyl ester carboxylesterase